MTTGLNSLNEFNQGKYKGCIYIGWAIWNKWKKPVGFNRQ